MIFSPQLLVFITLLFCLDTCAASPLQQSPHPGISVPLQSIHGFRLLNDVHPAVYHQRHINRGLSRLARMTGHRIPSRKELSKTIQRRVARLSPEIQKRYTSAARMDGVEAILDDTEHETNLLDGLENEQNSVGLSIESNDVGYYMSLHIGTPPRPFKLLVDSGSADLWVAGEHCQTDDGSGGGCGPHTFYEPNSSSTFKDTQDEWIIQYGSGDVSGTTVRDDVSVADFTLTGFAFGVSRTESSSLTSDDVPFDGILGLAQSKLSKLDVPTLVEGLQKTGQIFEAIVSYMLPRLADVQNGACSGELSFGGMNPAKYDPKSLVTLENLNSRGLWEAAIDRMTVNGKSMGWLNRTGILDTGTTLMILPKEDCDTVHSVIPGAQYDSDQQVWSVPCTTSVSISLSFGGRDFHIDPRDMAFTPLDQSNPHSQCYSGLQPGDVDGPNTWLMGDTFLKNVYFSTNVGRNEISLARPVANC